MKHCFYILLMFTLVACSSRNGLADHEAICNISGKGFDTKTVRVALAFSDIRFDPYQELEVKDGCFESKVILDTNQAYEILIPDPEDGFSMYRSLVFFYSKDGVRFEDKLIQDEKHVVLAEPTGYNKIYCDYHNWKSNLHAAWIADLMESQDSLFNIGQMYSQHFNDLGEQLQEENLQEAVVDSLRREIQKLQMSGEDRTPAGQMWMQEYWRYKAAKQECDYNHLDVPEPDPTCMYILLDNIRVSKQHYEDISKWLDIYERKYKGLFPDNRIHGLIAAEKEAVAMREGKQFVDFTLKDADGAEQTLSKMIDGKVAVLELWASWCASCRLTAKTFKPLYEKYKDSNFIVVGVAREYKETGSWLKALEKDAYPWPNMVALEENHNIWAQYGCPNSAGRTLLIDKEGKIVKIDPSAKEVEEYLLAL